MMKPDIVSQKKYMTDSEYLEKFRTQLDVLKSAGGDMCSHPGMVVQDELDRAGVGPREMTQKWPQQLPLPGIALRAPCF
jgi:hypothetical protein